MDLNKYYVFTIVYQTRNFTKAAKILNSTQPSVSYTIRELENQLAIPLFYRKHNGVEPTKEGEELYRYIHEALNTIILGENKIKEVSSLDNGIIRIGVPSHIGTFFVNNIIRDFISLHPKTRFEIISKSSSAMIELMEQKSLDLVIDNVSIEQRPANSIMKHLKIFNNCFIASKKFREKLSKNPNLIELSSNNLIVPNVGSFNRTELEKFLRIHNIEIYPLIEVWTTEMMLDLVSKDLGIGYFVKEIISNSTNIDNYEIFEFDDLPKLSIQMLYIQEYQSFASRTFINYMEERCFYE